MASPNIYGAVGGTTGARLATRKVYQSGVRWYVDSANGSDAASPRGKDRVRPLATLAQAHTNAAAGDTIVLLAGHQETLTSAQTFSKAGIRVYSEGTTATRAKFTCNGTIAMFDVTAAGVWFENLLFPASSAVPTARVQIATAGCQVVDCQFEAGASDTAGSLKLVTGAGQCRISGTTFKSVATAVASQPAIGLHIANAMSDLELEDVTFDGGTVGWSDYAFKADAAITRLIGIDVDLLNDSDLILATGSVYEFHQRNASGSARLEFTA